MTVRSRRRAKFSIVDLTPLIDVVFLLLIFMILPFSISFIITSGYNPPRLYVAMGIAFAFIITLFMSEIRITNVVKIIWALAVFINIYYITNLFWHQHQIYEHDKNIGRGIAQDIRLTYPDFRADSNYVYFYGHLPIQEYEKYMLQDSEIFTGSFFMWDNGSNDRIINFMKFSDIAHYKMIDSKDKYLEIKDSIDSLPVWPKQGYVKRINDVVVVKLGDTKGAPLWVE